MIIGVPKEVKLDEYRVAMLPVGVEELTRRGHQVLIEQGAGLGSGLSDQDYLENGCEMVATPQEIFARADMIVKVKEPMPAEWPLLRKGQIVFTYFHFAADRVLTESVLASGCTAVAYETLADDQGRLPLLTPMSEVAGRMSIQEGAKFLERPQQGRGILLGIRQVIRSTRLKIRIKEETFVTVVFSTNDAGTYHMNEKGFHVLLLDT